MCFFAICTFLLRKSKILLRLSHFFSSAPLFPCAEKKYQLLKLIPTVLSKMKLKLYRLLFLFLMYILHIGSFGRVQMGTCRQSQQHTLLKVSSDIARPKRAPILLYLYKVYLQVLYLWTEPQLITPFSWLTRSSFSME